jgi:hypothetical protein
VVMLDGIEIKGRMNIVQRCVRHHADALVMPSWCEESLQIARLADWRLDCRHNPAALIDACCSTIEESER